MARLVRAAVTLLCVLWLPAPLHAQEVPQQTIEIDFPLHNPPRDIEFWRAVGEAANRTADIALDHAVADTGGRDAKQIAWRLGRLWFVSMPIAAFAHGGAHDAGHFARDEDIGGVVHSRHVIQWPWPVPVFVTVENRTEPMPDLPPVAFLGPLGGGEQAALVLKRRLADAAYTTGTIGYFDATLFAYAALDFPVYAWTDLRPRHFTSEDAFYTTGTPGDFRQYVEAECARSVVVTVAGRDWNTWTEPSMALMDRFAGQIRKSAWLNFADTALWGAVHQAVRYVATGEREGQMPALSVLGVRFSAGTYATLGSTGLERGLDVRIQQPQRVIRLNLRNISAPDGRTRWGGGIGLLPRARRGLRPTAQVDVWRGLDNEVGGRIEAGVRRTFKAAGQPFDTGFTVGYKSDGYLPDAPARRGVLGSIFTTIRF